MTVEDLPADALVIELPPPMYLNQSRWKTYQACDRLYGWLHVEQLVSSRPRKPLVIGTAVHKAQLFIHEHGNTPESILGATDVAAEEVRKRLTPIGPKLPDDEKMIQDSVSLVKKMLPAYHRYWGDLGQLWRPIGQELFFCVEVGEGTNVFLVGTIDNMVVFMGGLWIVDYKTMAAMKMSEFTKYEIDIQLTAYIYGGSKQLSIEAEKAGKPPVRIRGAIIDGMIKTLIPQFHREQYLRTMDDLREFELEFCMKAWEIAAKHAMVRKDKKAYDLYTEKMYSLGSESWKIAFPKNTQQCFQYGECSHRDMCVKDTEVRRMAYIKRTPDYVDVEATKTK